MTAGTWTTPGATHTTGQTVGQPGRSTRRWASLPAFLQAPAGLRLAALAGADIEVLAQHPEDATKWNRLGSQIVLQGVLAGLGGMLAAHLAFGVHSPAGLAAAGLLTGLLVANADALLVAIGGGWGSLPIRLTLASLLGLLLSYPYLMLAFYFGIQAQIPGIVQDAKTALYQAVQHNADYQQIPTLKAEIDTLTTTATQQGGVDTSTDPTVKGAHTEVDRLQSAYNQANATYLTEIDGTGGTGKIGDGPAAAPKKAARDQIGNQLDTAKQTLTNAQAAATTRLRTNATTNATTANTALPTKQTHLSQLTAHRDTDLANGLTAASRTRGLDIQLTALDRLTKTNTWVLLAHWLFALTLVAIDLLPVLGKLLMTRNPTNYDTTVTAKHKRTQATATTSLTDTQITLDATTEATRIRAQIPIDTATTNRDTAHRLDQQRADTELTTHKTILDEQHRLYTNHLLTDIRTNPTKYTQP